MNSQQSIGTIIKIIRAKKGLSQKQMAQRVGLSMGTISRIENGHEIPHANTIEAIIHTLALDEKTSQELMDAVFHQSPFPVDPIGINIQLISTAAFQGRSSEILKTKTWACDKSPNAPTLMVISGIPGIGKSTLAAHVCQEKELTRVFTQILWLSAANQPSQGLWVTLAETLQIDSKGTSNLRSSVLRALQAQTCLIVLDDLDQRIDLSEWILPGGSKSKILVTTFLSDLVMPRLSSQIVSLTLDALPKESAEKILLAGIEDFDAHDAELMLAIAGGLPLALELANALARLDGNLRWISHQMAENSIQALELSNPVRKQDSLKIVFQAAYQRLSQADQEFFTFLSVFAPPFDVEVLQQIIKWNIRDILQALRNLQSLSLLQRMKQNYTVHNLVHNFAREVALQNDSQKITDLEIRFASHFMELGQKAAAAWDEGNEEYAMNLWHANLTSISLGCQYAARHQQWDWVVEYLVCNASYSGMIQRTDLLSDWQKLVENNHLPTLHKIKCLLGVADGFAQAKHWNEVLRLTATVTQITETNQNDFLWFITNLLAIQAHLDRGDINQAGKALQNHRFRQIREQTDLPFSFALQASILSAKTYRLLGQFEQALYSQEKALAMLNPSASPQSIITMSAIFYERGQTFFTLKKYENALKAFDESCQLTAGTTSAAWAHSMLMSAWALARVGRTDEAQQRLTKLQNLPPAWDVFLENMLSLVRAEIVWETGARELGIREYRQVVTTLGDSSLAINALFILAERQREIGPTEEVANTYHEAMLLARKIGQTAAFVDAALLYAELMLPINPHAARYVYEEAAVAAKSAQLYGAASEAYRAMGHDQEADELDALDTIRKSVYRLPIEGGAADRSISTFFLYSDGDQEREDFAGGF